MVVNFSFSGVNGCLVELSNLIRVSHNNMQRPQGTILHGVSATERQKDQQALTDCKDSASKTCDLLEALLSWIECDHIGSAIRALRQWSKAEYPQWSELNTRARALRNAIITELRRYLFYQYPLEKGRKFAAWKDEWKTIVDAFPQCAGDVFDAVDCYGLQKETASVFYSMRIAEHGMRALAKERRLKLPKDKPLEWGSWMEIIKALDTEIGAIGRKRPGATKDAALEFYSGARADLNGFKDEYRNLVMHVRATYDEHQALRALTKVQAFMERLATKIGHSRARINWGRF